MRSTIDTLLMLMRAGLWEMEGRLSVLDVTNLKDVHQLAEEQSVVGLIAAGLEHVKEKVPQEVALTFAGSALQLEQRNKSMNEYVAWLIERLREEDIYALLVKGQGIAQCFERPLWRAAGDIDLLFSEVNYEKAKAFLLPLSSCNKNEERYSQHLGMNIDSWYVEIHGTLRTGLSSRVDKVIDKTQDNVFLEGAVRSWKNGDTQVFLPSPDNDVFFVFTHFIKHFYKEGMTLRQICDWCRLLWTFRDTINKSLLVERLRSAGLMSEWRSFASLAVNYLGMPTDAMPLFEKKECWHRKAKQIINLILCGYKHNALLDSFAIAKIFPGNTIRFLPSILLNVNGLKIQERLFGRK